MNIQQIEQNKKAIQLLALVVEQNKRTFFPLDDTITLESEINFILNDLGEKGLTEFQSKIKDALSILEIKKHKNKMEYDAFEKEYKDNHNQEWAEKTEGFAETGVQLEMMIKKTKECLEFHF